MQDHHEREKEERGKERERRREKIGVRSSTLQINPCQPTRKLGLHAF